MERDGGRADRGRVLLTLADRRTRIDEHGRDLEQRLAAAVDAAGWPRFQTILSRSPRVEALNSATAHTAFDPPPRQGHEHPPRAARAGRGGDQAARPRRRREADGAPTDRPERVEPNRTLVDELRSALLRGLRGGR